MATEEEIKQQLEEANKKAKELEGQLKVSEGKLRDTTAESMKRKEAINEFKDKETERKQQETEAQAKAEEDRIAALPDPQRQPAEMKSLVERFEGVVSGLNAKIEGLSEDVKANNSQVMTRSKSAAVDEVLSGINFHNKEDAKRFIDLDEVPTKNGEPDKDWIREKANAIATEKAYLLKPAAVPIPAWGGTMPPNPAPGPKPPVTEKTPEQKGAEIVDRAAAGDTRGALFDAIAGTPGIDQHSAALGTALKTP